MINNMYSDYKGLFIGNSGTGKYINFDNAATTQCMSAVARVVNDTLTNYGSLHRGKGFKSKYSSEQYEISKAMVADFVGADKEKNTVIYTKNTTEGINILANCLQGCNANSVILSTHMEHHSNDLPWRKNFHVDYINIDELGQINIDNMVYKLRKHKGRVRLVAVTGASNVTGIKSPIHLIAKIAHFYGAEILVDGAQLVPHCSVNIKSNEEDEHIDYIVFSAHKMYAPFGTGVLIGGRENFMESDPDYVGGGTVNIVNPRMVTWLDPYEKNEAGTPNLIGAVALAESIDMLSQIGMNEVENYESALTQYAYSRLQTVDGINIYCPYTDYGRVSILSFNIENIHHEVLARALENEGIAVRNGCFCAQNYTRLIMGVDSYDTRKVGMVRISFALYNTINEVDYFIKVLKKIIRRV